MRTPYNRRMILRLLSDPFMLNPIANTLRSSNFKKVLFSVPLLCGVLLTSATTQASKSSFSTDTRPTITFVCEPRPNQPNYNDALNYLTGVFDELGYRYIQKHENAKEAIRQLKAGEVDGDCGRLNGFAEMAGLADDYVPLDPVYVHASFSSWYLKRPTAPRDRLRVGYNSNAILLEKHLREMGFEQLFPITKQADLTQLVIDGELDMVINYDGAMDFAADNIDSKALKQTNSFMTQPVRPYIHKSLAQKLSKDWPAAAKKSLEAIKTPYEVTAIPAKVKGKVTFSCSLVPNNNLFRYLDHYYSKMFRSLGYEFQLVSMPRTRETHELSKGSIDGSCGRTIAHQSQQANVIRVNTPIIASHIRVWSRNPGHEIESLEELSPSSTLVLVRGTSILDNKLKSFKGQVVHAANMATAVKMLAAGRVDYLIGFELTFQNSIAGAVIQSPIYAVGKFESVALYPYFHDEQLELAQRLEQLLLQTSVAKGN